MPPPIQNALKSLDWKNSTDKLDLPRVLIAGPAGVYLAPTLIALIRDHPRTWPICLINAFLGWTGVGWFVALIWSVLPISKRNRVPDTLCCD